MTIDVITPGARVLCAVSGGVDSMYLLHRMTELAAQRGFTVGCAHFNHALRGAESDRDEAFVRAQCQRLNVPFYAGRGDVASVRGMGTEGAARQLRYAFLTDCAAAHGYDWIATAHTADDNAETLLLNLARGCGLRVTREQGRLFFGAQRRPPLGTYALIPGQTTEIPELGMRFTVGMPEPFREIHSAFTTFVFKSAIIHDKLSVTPRRPGDRIRLAGRGCTKRVSDLLAERGLTQDARERVPIIRAADVPVAIAGFGVAEQWAAVPDQTMVCIRMEQIQTYGGEYYERYER